MSIISASTTSTTAYKVTADTTGTLVLQTGSAPTTAVTIDASQNVGVGTTSILGNSTVNAVLGFAARNSGASAGYFQTYNSNAGTDLKTWRFGGNSSGALNFETVNDAYSSATGRMTLNSNGVLALQGGNTSANGVGIAFPASQSASSDANTLDDYEEGTWTPTIGGTSTYTTQIGRYTKIGNVVIAEFYMSVNLKGTGSSSDISGLPFSINGSVQGSGTVSYYQSLAVNVIGLAAYGYNSTVFRFYGRDTSGASASGPLGIFGNGSTVQGNIIYTV